MKKVISSTLDPAATALAAAHSNGRRIAHFNDEIAPRDLEQAYNVQAAVAQLCGKTVAAYKIGMAHRDIWSSAGLDEPIVGIIDKSEIFKEPASLVVGQNHLMIVESEIIFEIGSDVKLEDAPFTAASIQKHVAHLYAGFEVCNSRFEDSDNISIPALIADNSCADRILLGDELTGGSIRDFDDLPVILFRSREADVIGTTANVCNNPFEALAWLANWCSLRGTGLLRGQLVASGSCTGMTRVELGETVTARFGNMGEVTMKLIQN